jgi:excisionase family DNA binding protein
LQSGKEMLSVLEAPAKLNVSRDTIHRLIKAGEIKAHKKPFAPHSAYLIDRASVEAYDRERRALVS